MKKKIAFFMHYRHGGGGVNTLSDFYIKSLSENYDIDLYLEGIEDPNNLVKIQREIKKIVKNIKYYDINPIRALYLHELEENYLPKNKLQEMKTFIEDFNKIHYSSVICFVGNHEFLFNFMTNAENKISFIHTDFKAEKEMKSNWLIRLSKNCDKWIGVSKTAAENFKEYVPHRKDDVFYITNTADFNNVESKSKKIIWSAKERKVLNSSSPVIGIVGRIEDRQKYTTRMLKVSNLLNKNNINHKMVFIGPVDPNSKDEIEKWEKAIEKYNLNNSIFWFGSKSNPYKYFKKFDLYALCSKYEGLSIALLESLSLNTKTIVTNTVSLEFADNKNICAICENNTNSIYKKIENLIVTNFKEFDEKENSKDVVISKQKQSLKLLKKYVEGNYEK